MNTDSDMNKRPKQLDVSQRVLNNIVRELQQLNVAITR